MYWASRLGASVAAAIVLVASLAVVAEAKDSGVSRNGNELVVTVTGSPIANIITAPLPLTPTFGRGIGDYVWRCQSGSNALHVTLVAQRGGTLRIGDRRGSTLTIDESLLENQALVIAGPWSHAWAAASHADSSADERNDEARGRTEYWIRCLPHDFPQLKVVEPARPPSGWYLTGNFTVSNGSGPYVMVLDRQGTPVWYRRSPKTWLMNLTAVAVNVLAWNENVFGGAYNVSRLVNASTEWLQPDGFFLDGHELEPMPNGNFAVLSAPVRYGVDAMVFGGTSNDAIYDCMMLEVDPRGKVVWKWSASDHIALSQSVHFQRSSSSTPWDPYHCNSIEFDPNSGDLLLSARNTSAVYRINKASGRIVWKLSGNSVTGEGEPHLTISGDPFGGFDAQHDARFQSNGDVSVYDDESYRPEAAARGAQYRIDARHAAAALVWSFKSPDDLESRCTGSFRRLYGGTDNVIGWGCKRGTLLTETDGSGKVLLTISFPAGEFAYRAIKVYPAQFDRDLLRATAGLTPGMS